MMAAAEIQAAFAQSPAAFKSVGDSRNTIHEFRGWIII